MLRSVLESHQGSWLWVGSIWALLNDEDEVIGEKSLASLNNENEASLNSRGRAFQAEEKNTQSPGDRKELSDKN